MTHPDAVHPANRLGIDYAAAAKAMAPPVPIIDVHTHINGRRAATIYRRAAETYGVVRTWSMTRLEEIDVVREAMGGRIDFIAVPDYWGKEDLRHRLGAGFIDRIERYHRIGARIVKFWVAPRSRDMAREAGAPDLARLDAPERIAAMEAATELGMMLMTHVADPDTWFRTKYADAGLYGTKASQYEPLEMLLERFSQPWLAAHMGGWPEDLEFLTGLLGRHSNLHLDTSATKWMVRELSRHSREELLAFLRRFEGRILFGSDIVSTDDHLDPSADDNDMQAKAGDSAEAFDLYASRYWALRTLFETDYDGPSPIADPDLAMEFPGKHAPLDAPRLAGKSLPRDVLASIYSTAATSLMARISEGCATGCRE